METALPILLFFGFLFGFGILIIACGYQSRQQEQLGETSPLDLALQGVPRFFGKPNQPGIANPVAVVIEESAVRRLEQFLQEEMAMAEVFVGVPSEKDRQHERASSESGASLFERLESYLQREHEAAAKFVQNPSIESLYCPLETLAPAF